MRNTSGEIKAPHNCPTCIGQFALPDPLRTQFLYNFNIALLFVYLPASLEARLVTSQPRQSPGSKALFSGGRASSAFPGRASGRAAGTDFSNALRLQWRWVFSTLCCGIVPPVRKSAFRAGIWPDCYREGTESGPPAGRRPAGKLVFSRLQSGPPFPADFGGSRGRAGLKTTYFFAF